MTEKRKGSDVVSNAAGFISDAVEGLYFLAEVSELDSARTCPFVFATVAQELLARTARNLNDVLKTLGEEFDGIEHKPLNLSG